jgi:hypothetical protein
MSDASQGNGAPRRRAARPSGAGRISAAERIRTDDIIDPETGRWIVPDVTTDRFVKLKAAGGSLKGVRREN